MEKKGTGPGADPFHHKRVASLAIWRAKGQEALVAGVGHDRRQRKEGGKKKGRAEGVSR